MIKTMTKALCSVVLLALASSALASKGEPWLTNMEQAQKVAKAEGKDIFMFFTGSDWCGWCIRLDEEVLSKEEFLAYAKDNLVLVDLDFPQDEELLSEAQKAHNEQWRSRFNVDGFPTVYLTDSSANPYAKTSYREGGPIKFTAFLKEQKAGIALRDELLAKAAEVSGLARAKLLDELLSQKDIAIDNRDELMAEIIELSKSDKALNSKYLTIKGNKTLMDDMRSKVKPNGSSEEALATMLALFEEYSYLKEGGSLAQLVQGIGMTYSKTDQSGAAVTFLDKMLADTSYDAAFLQYPGVVKAFVIAEAGDVDGAATVLDETIALAPKTEMAKQRDSLLKQIQSIARH